MEVKFRLIIGLGNPDRRYAYTYHNVGFLAADYLKNNPKLRIHPNLQILKSETYMNESGRFVVNMVRKYNIKPEKILIVHDDSDIESGKYKFSFGRGSAGHKGVESVINALKTKNFWRLRIGIRPKKVLRKKAEEFVLKKITKKDLAVFNKVLEESLKTYSI